jgi:quercetin dioxygenase-like cupin family protein
MKYIHAQEDLKETFAGFRDRPEKDGYTVIIAGPQELYSYEKTGKKLNQFPTKRLMVAIHTWPPGKPHGGHHHLTWEQCYYVFAGQAEISVGNEKKIVGPGGSAYMPAGMEHDIAAVGDETLVAAVIGCVLDEDEAS